MVTVGLDGNRVTDPAGVSASLLAAGATADEVRARLHGRLRPPDLFRTGLYVDRGPLRAAGWQEQRPVPNCRHRLPDTRRPALSSPRAWPPTWSAPSAPFTAEELPHLGPAYAPTSTVGQTGLEAAYQTQLAGQPGGTITVVDADGQTGATVAVFPPKPGTAVQTSIDPAVQQAAEAALAPVSQYAALVAVRASTGQVLAAVSVPEADPFDQALAGEFPPGSTFKIITATALIEKGLAPSSPATCPPCGHRRRRTVPQRRRRRADEHPAGRLRRVLQHRLHQPGDDQPPARHPAGGGGHLWHRRRAASRPDGLRRPRADTSRTRPDWPKRPSARRRWWSPR